MKEYEHEDAFKAANQHAGNVTNISQALKCAESKLQASVIIAEAQKTYSDLFSAFIAGVDWARQQHRYAEEPKK